MDSILNALHRVRKVRLMAGLKTYVMHNGWSLHSIVVHKATPTVYTDPWTSAGWELDRNLASAIVELERHLTSNLPGTWCENVRQDLVSCIVALAPAMAMGPASGVKSFLIILNVETSGGLSASVCLV